MHLLTSAAQAMVSPAAQPTTRTSSRTAIVGSSRRRGALITGATWTKATATNPSPSRSTFLTSATATSPAAARTPSTLGSAPRKGAVARSLSPTSQGAGRPDGEVHEDHLRDARGELVRGETGAPHHLATTQHPPAAAHHHHLPPARLPLMASRLATRRRAALPRARATVSTA